jgi:hypothetical protein
MTDPLEDRLKEVLDEDAHRAPVLPPRFAQAVMHRERRRSRRRVAMSGGAVTVTLAVVVGLGTGLIPGVRTTDPPVVESLCVAEYTSRAAADQAFAFDGTVTRIGREHDDSIRAGTFAVTFTVNEWFRGGSEATVTVDMPASGTEGSDESETGSEAGPVYALHTRLLVSGQPRFGGAALTDPVAWGCGFTRAYDAATAEEWRTAVKAGAGS